MTSDRTFVIVGASLAGAKAAETLRAELLACIETKLPSRPARKNLRRADANPIEAAPTGGRHD